MINHLLLKATTSNKDDRRKLVTDQHNVLLLLGDNLGDFSGIFDHKTYEKRSELAEDSSAVFGKRFIVLPNPMYGEWLGALLNYQYQLTKEQQNAALLKWLRTY
ncbi:MAG: HAD family acid phosphatase [Ginsengibacter sp.]